MITEADLGPGGWYQRFPPQIVYPVWTQVWWFYTYRFWWNRNHIEYFDFCGIAERTRMDAEANRSPAPDVRLLCAAMLMQAVKDVIHPTDCTPKQRERVRQAAFDWIHGCAVEDVTGLTFEDVCAALCVDVDYARQQFAQPQPEEVI